MDTITTTPVLTNNDISTTDILFACITHRLKKHVANIPDAVKDAMAGLLQEGKRLVESQQNSMSYVKSLCPSGRSYERCDSKFTDGRKLIQYLEQHPTYRLSKLHKNNVTWYQISDIIQFTTDLVEECYEAGRTELVQFIIDWCVSFINKQSCIYTSDGWADMLTILPEACDSRHGTVSVHPLSASYDGSLIEKYEPTSHKGILRGLLLSKASSGITARVSPDAHSPDEREEPERNQEDMPDEKFHNVHLKKKSTKKTSFTETRLMEKISSSTTLATTVETSNDKELSLLTCSCGHKSETRYGNFIGVCDRIECRKSTCLLCCLTVNTKARTRHMAQHRINFDSIITKEHRDMNTALFTSECSNCDNRSCVQRSFHDQNMAACKLCDSYFCTYPGCGKLGKYAAIYWHVQNKHPTETVISKTFTSSNSDTSGKSRKLHPLRCGCKNIDSIERHGKFWCKCGIPSCEYYQYYICLICGRTTKCKESILNIHLGQHETDLDGAISEKHVEANLKLYNKVCGTCGQQSSAKFNMVNRQTLARCRCCNTYICMFPGCEKFFLKKHSSQVHYKKMHS